MATWLDGIDGVMTEESIENEETGNVMLLEYQDGYFWSFTEELGNGFKVLGRPDDGGTVRVDLWGSDGLYLFIVESPCLDDALQELQNLMDDTLEALMEDLNKDVETCPDWFAPQLLGL